MKKSIYNITRDAERHCPLVVSSPALFTSVSGGASDPFIAYSPISDRMIVSERTGEKESVIYPLDADGVREEGVVYTKEQRDSLLPQLYFTQLVAREQMPDSINGIEISIPLLKYNSWFLHRRLATSTSVLPMSIL